MTPTLALTDDFFSVDSATLLKIAMEVCNAIPAEMSNVSRTESVEVIAPVGLDHNRVRKEFIMPAASGSTETPQLRICMRVHYDNCSHASGKQRAWIACPLRRHQACFRYMLVEKASSDDHLRAILTAWAFGALCRGESFDKAAHKMFQPSESDIRQLSAD